MENRKLLKSVEAEALCSELLDALQTEHKAEGTTKDDTAIRMVRLAETWLLRLAEFRCDDDLVCLHYYHAMLYKLFATLNHFSKNLPGFTAKRSAFLARFKEMQTEVKSQMDSLLNRSSSVKQA